jgi:hypothetical protein
MEWGEMEEGMVDTNGRTRNRTNTSSVVIVRNESRSDKTIKMFIYRFDKSVEFIQSRLPPKASFWFLLDLATQSLRW